MTHNTKYTTECSVCRESCVTWHRDVSHMSESCLPIKSHVTHDSHMTEWVMCRAWMSHVIHDAQRHVWPSTKYPTSCSVCRLSCVTWHRDVSHMSELCLPIMSHVTHTWVSHVSRMHDLLFTWHTTHQVSNIVQRMSFSMCSMRDVTSRRVTYKRVMSHINELCHTWVSHVSREWDMPHVTYDIPGVQHSAAHSEIV